MISAVLISYNEGKLLKRCLESIKEFVSEIVVVDLGSTDDSAEVFKQYNVKVVNHSWVPYADPIRNFAIDQAKNDWILMLDPDEQVPSSLKQRLTDLLDSEESKKYTAVNIPFKNIFFDKWIAHTNFWPDKHLRFFKKGSLEWQDRVHLYPKVEGDILQLPAQEQFAVIHQSYKTWGEFVKKQTKYANSEATHRKEVGESFSIYRLTWLPLREFLARFIKHQGYLDGINGVFIVATLMWYHVLVEWFLLTGINKDEIR